MVAWLCDLLDHADKRAVAPTSGGRFLLYDPAQHFCVQWRQAPWCLHVVSLLFKTPDFQVSANHWRAFPTLRPAHHSLVQWRQTLWYRFVEYLIFKFPGFRIFANRWQVFPTLRSCAPLLISMKTNAVMSTCWTFDFWILDTRIFSAVSSYCIHMSQQRIQS